MKTKKRSNKEEMLLQLNGEISLITKKGGKTTKKEVLDGKVMLEALRYMLTKAVDEAVARAGL